jgi:hypothetical protein
MNVVVVGMEEIEGPWRDECQHLQKMILELMALQKTDHLMVILYKDLIIYLQII